MSNINFEHVGPSVGRSVSPSVGFPFFFCFDFRNSEWLWVTLDNWTTLGQFWSTLGLVVLFFSRFFSLHPHSALLNFHDTLYPAFGAAASASPPLTKTRPYTRHKMRPRPALRHFQRFLQKRNGPTDQRTDQRTNGRTNGRTHPLIESLGRD